MATIINPGFEVDLSGWSKNDADASTTWTRDTTITNAGSAGSSKLVNTVAGADDYITPTGSVSGIPPSTLVEGRAWVNVTAFTAAAVGNRGLALVSAGNLVTAPITAATTGWVELAVQTTTAAAGGLVEFRLYAPQGTTYWDDVELREYRVFVPHRMPLGV